MATSNEQVLETPVVAAAAPVVDDDGDLSFLNAANEDPPVEIPAAETPAEATAEPVIPPAATPVPELPKARHPAGLRRRALAYGATAEQIDAASLDDLDAWVEEQDSVQPAPAKPAVPVVTAEDAIDWGTDAQGVALTEADIAPGIAKNIKAAHKKNKELESRIQGAEQRETARQQRSIEETCDMAFDGMAKFKAVFGAGDLRELKKGSKEWNRRVAVYRAAAIDQNLDSPAVMKRKLDRAAEELFGDLVQVAKPVVPIKPKVEANPYEEEIAAAAAPKNGEVKRYTAEEWEQAKLAVPTNRRPRQPGGRAGMLAAAKEWAAKQGVTSGAQDDPFPGVPD